MRVAIVSGICVADDAISTAMVAQATLCMMLPEVDEVAIFAQHVDRRVGVQTFTVSSSWELVRHPWFRACDVAIFHWGIHYQLFDALALLNVSGPGPVCHFHNCTPAALVHPDQRAEVERSMAQFASVV